MNRHRILNFRLLGDDTRQELQSKFFIHVTFFSKIIFRSFKRIERIAAWTLFALKEDSENRNAR
jgi:hypothetical protein